VLPPGGSARPLGRGLAVIATAGLVLLTALSLAAPAGAKQVFGIVPQDGALPSGEDLDLMPSGGISAMRMMLPWDQVEKTPGEYDWTQIDAVIRETTKRGIQPFPFLYGTPAWAARRDHQPCSGTTCAVYAPKSGATRAAFAAFAKAAAARYGPGGDFWEAPVQTPAARAVAPSQTPISLSTPIAPSATADAAPQDEDGLLCPVPVLCPPPPPPPVPPTPDPPLPNEPPCGCTEPHPITTWQILNEQNSPKYFAPEPNVRRYAAIVKATGSAIRSVDPGADIILGGMWGPGSAKNVVTPVKQYLEALYEVPGAADSFDSIAIHPYAVDAGDSVAQLKAAHRTVTKAGDDAHTWVSEIGWPGGGPAKNPFVKTLNGQARVLARALSAYERERRSLGLRGVFWYSWRDKKGGTAICEWCGHAGLRAKDGSAKPAWRAFVRVTRP
jgi:hypothetical protein